METSLFKADTLAASRVTSCDRDWERIAQGEQGTLVPLLCSKCRQRNCVDCNNMMEKSPQTAYEDEILADSLTLEKPDADKPGVWTVIPPYNQRLDNVPDLEEATKTFQLRLEERKLKVKPELAVGLNEKIQEGIDRGDFVWYDDLVKEYGEHIGKHRKCFSPINFVKKLSATTTTRPVFNQSFAPDPRYPALNDARFRGSSGNKNIAHVLLNARLWRYYGLGDLQRFYQSVKLKRVEDMLLNCFYFREGGYGSDGDLRILCSRVVNFGQRDAQAVVSIAKHKTSELFILPHSRECYEQLKFALTDDTGLGHDTREGLQELINIATEGMRAGSFVYKGWVIGGESSDVTVIGHKDHNTGTCLGLLWSVESDCWSIPCSLNMSAKSRGLRDPKFDINSLSDMTRFLDSFELSKRALLRYTASWYDPLYLCGQVRAYLTLIYRRAIKTLPGQRWEDAVTPEIYSDLLKVTKMIFELEDIKISRFAFSDIVGKEIEILASCDGSDLLSAVRIFCRYKTGPNTYRAQYLFGSILLIGSGDESSVRCECHAFYMGVKLLALTQQIIRNYTIKQFYILSDSQITLSGVCSLTANQKLYFRQRNSFSRSQIEKMNIKVLYCPGAESDSDIFTKMRKDSFNGALHKPYWESNFFYKDYSDWPTSEYVYNPVHIKNEILDPGLTVCVLKTGIWQSGNVILNRIIYRFSVFSAMVKCLSYVYLFLPNETLASARERARLTLLRSVHINDDVVTGLRRSFRVEKSDDLWWVLPREYYSEGNVTQEKLILVDGRSEIGRSVIKMVHCHVAGVGREISQMYRAGVYVTHHRALFKRLQASCYTCRRLRRLNLETCMGPNHQVTASLNVASFVICYMDPCGPFRVDLGGSKVGKLFILSVCCIFSRYLCLVPLTDMSASSIVKAVRMAGYQTGGVIPQLIFTDNAANLKTLIQFEEKNEEEGSGDIEITIDNLKRVFHSNGITLRPSASKSPWRLGGIESQQKIFKTALKRSNLYHQKLKLTDWLYVLKKMENEINNRGICLSYMEDNFSYVSPRALLFGQKKNDLPRDINLNEKDGNLFEAVRKIDKEINMWLDVYQRSYALQIKKFFKWKQKKTLDKGDVCYILDRITEAGTFTLGIVVDILSPRTYELEYVKKSARLDKKTYKVTRSAKKSKLTRPINQLTFICKKSECENVNIEVFDVDQTRPERRGEFAHQVSDEFLGEDEIFVENQGDNNEVDHNLDDMIISDKPMEVSDEISENLETINDKEDKGEVNDVDKMNFTGIREISDEMMNSSDDSYNMNNGEISSADKKDDKYSDYNDEMNNNGEVSSADKNNDSVHNNGETSNTGKIDENTFNMENMKQEKILERHQEDGQAPRRSARNKAKAKIDYSEMNSGGRRRTRRH